MIPAFAQIIGLSAGSVESPVLNSVDLSIRRGEIFAIVGPSGCGKSMLLRIIAGLEAPSSGEILIEGRPIDALPPDRRPVNLLFQSYALFPHITVEQNVAFGLGQGKLSKEVIAERVKRTLALVGLGEIAGRKPDQITVAQQQRLALARCLAKEPKLLLLDEPTANLDRELRTGIQLEIAEILRRVRATTILVTRDREEAMVMADRLALMKSGRIVQTGTPTEVYESPNCMFSAQLLGAINLFSGTVASAEDGIAVVEVPDLDIPLKVIVTEAVRPGSVVTVAVRPERFVIQVDRPDSRHNVCSGFIEDSAYAGAYTHYYVRLKSGRTIVVLSEARERQRAQPLDSGARLFVAWDVTDGVILES